jgi:nucleotide-binding universal stress UspA family protein
LDEYCKKAGIGSTPGGVPSREIIVCEGDVEENILKYAKEYGCGMIVLAAHEGLFSKSSLSSIIKNVLRRSTVPVLTVPHVFVKSGT